MRLLQKTQTLKHKSDQGDKEERTGYKMTENHKKWLNSVGRCVLMVLTYLNTLGTHGASKKMIFFSLLTLNALRAS